jgi:hypothetical protein
MEVLGVLVASGHPFAGREQQVVVVGVKETPANRVVAEFNVVT